ncbi:hypothetical protein J3E72DRAFT_37289 [Bipolaris maydis]|uniref:uncharacterized protein n=1 Tax=Cochliobolus heterostrophus TaxID=5016 RepID=UPI0024DB5121|nr:hypothetical protein J3E73DRAFT_37571 [Bipolaris maydis]KAJ6198983.1 hypothetical protein J3E72DRAFT_37289 [Bipolaris maydis]KAJ6204887.1 hypothetical protein PSV09DRAFT_2016522 [Bipolaris maydis]KAJ6266412.1 hypothetical protein PSV08DRAFT_15688 [Bipolaris maydis]
MGMEGVIGVYFVLLSLHPLLHSLLSQDFVLPSFILLKGILLLLLACSGLFLFFSRDLFPL